MQLGVDNMELLVKLNIPSPGCASTPEKPDKLVIPLEDEIHQMLEKIDSHHESNVEWRAIKRFYTDLCKAKQTDRVKNLRKMIRPVLAKYGFHVE